MVKKSMVVGLVLGFILAGAVLAGAADVKNITVASSSMGGTLYLSASRWVEEMKRQIPGINFTSQPGIHAKNMTAIEKGVIQVGFGDTATQNFAYEGVSSYTEKHKKLRYLGICQPMPTQLVVPKDSKIKSIADLHDKRINPLPKGSATRLIVEAMLEKYGITYDSIQKKGGVVYGVSYSDAANLMQNGQMDMLTSWSLVPSHVLTRIQNPGIRILPIDKADEMLKDPRFLGYHKVILKKGAHDGVVEDTLILASHVTCVVSADLPDELVYKMAKVFFETPALKDFYKRELEVGLGGSFDAQNSYLAASIPFHPGVEKYFKEKGARLK